MSELVRSVGLLSGQQLILVLIGAARVKLIATLLGPAGTGLLAQTVVLQDVLRQTSLLGAGNGYLKLVAEAVGRDDRDTMGRLITTSFALFGGLALLLATASMLCAPWLARLVFHDETLAPLVVIAAVGLVFAVPAVLFQRTLSGALQFRAYVQLSIADSLTGLAGTAALVWVLGLTGAVSALAIAEAATVVLGAWLVWRIVLRPHRIVLRPGQLDAAIVRRLFRLGGTLALTSLVAAGSALVVRSAILGRDGAEANGYYQVAWQVGQNYLGILSASLWTYGMPKIATKVHDPSAVQALQDDFLRIALAVLAPGILVLLCAREVWVPVLYTRAFLAAAPMLCWQLGGELVAMLRQSMNISLLPRERLGFLLFQAVFYWAGWALLSLLLLPRVGATGVAIAYCTANVAALVVTFAYHHRVLGYRVRPDDARLLAVTLPGFAIAVLLASGDDPIRARVVPLVLVAAWVVWNRRVYLDALASLRARS
ncbi:MAG: oligosaccharide flippase family protein [Candidatus Binatia bacterium]